MKSWTYAVNSYYKTADIYVEILPRRLYYLEKIVEYFCCIRILKWIKFPSFINYTYKNKDGSIEIYTLKEWWGDLGSWFHCVIHSPIFDYVYNSGRCKTFSLPADYELLKGKFKDIDKEYWERIIESEKEDEKDRIEENTLG